VHWIWLSIQCFASVGPLKVGVIPKKHFLECTVRKLASASSCFAWIIVLLLYILCFISILTFGKRKKLHTTKSGDYGRCGMTVTVILFRNLCTDSRVSTCTIMIEKLLGGNSTLVQIVFLTVQKSFIRNSQHVSSFMDSDPTVLEDKFCHLRYIFICFTWWWMFGIFSRVNTSFEIGKPLRTCVLPIAVRKLLSTLWKFL
jgi:hypothetical protein